MKHSHYSLHCTYNYKFNNKIESHGPVEKTAVNNPYKLPLLPN